MEVASCKIWKKPPIKVTIKKFVAWSNLLLKKSYPDCIRKKFLSAELRTSQMQPLMMLNLEVRGFPETVCETNVKKYIELCISEQMHHISGKRQVLISYFFAKHIWQKDCLILQSRAPSSLNCHEFFFKLYLFIWPVVSHFAGQVTYHNTKRSKVWLV